MNKISIGWVAKSKRGDWFAGHRARCKVYKSRAIAIAAQRGYRKTDEDVLSDWDIVEAFIEVAADE